MPAKQLKSRPKKATSKTKIHHHLISSVWPHHRNGYRPHLIRPIGLALVIGLAFGTQISIILPKPAPEPVVMGDMVDRTQEELLTFTNKERLNERLQALQQNDRLSDAAELKARDMLERQYWSHNAPDGTTPWSWFREVKYRYDYAGENLAKGFTEAEDVVTAWMNSPEHRENMLSPNYEDVGFAAVSGVLDGQSTMVIVAMYGSPVGKSTLAPDASVLSASEGDINPVARLGLVFKTMSPAQLGSVILLALAAIVALIAHAYRRKLPKSVQASWARHHGLYKFVALVSAIVGVVALYYGAGSV